MEMRMNEWMDQHGRSSRSRTLEVYPQYAAVMPTDTEAPPGVYVPKVRLPEPLI
jgi:hypothetical protein